MIGKIEHIRKQASVWKRSQEILLTVAIFLSLGVATNDFFQNMGAESSKTDPGKYSKDYYFVMMSVWLLQI